MIVVDLEKNKRGDRVSIIGTTMKIHMSESTKITLKNNGALNNIF